MRDFFQMDKKAIEMLPKIGHAGFVVYSALKMYMNQETKQCFPSQERLSEVCHYNKRQIARALKDLELYGLISVKRQQRKPNIYFLRDKTSWGEDIYSLGKGIIMRCPECDLPVVRDRVKQQFICPKCHMDVGTFCRDTLQHHFPGLSSRAIFGKQRAKNKVDSFSLSDAYYEARVGNDTYPEIPVSSPVDLYIDFGQEMAEVANG